MCSARKHVRATHRVEGSLLFDQQGKRYIDEAVIALRSSSGASAGERLHEPVSELDLFRRLVRQDAAVDGGPAIWGSAFLA